MGKLAASIIVPVFRDWHKLELLLEKLTVQDLGLEQDWEVLVVNNDVQADAGISPGGRVRIIHEPRGFSYAARNAGIAQARGAVLVFTDADCQPEPNWLRNGLDALRQSGSDILGGAVEIVSPRTGLVPTYDACFGLKQEYFLQRWSGMATANLFVRREVIGQVGDFRGELISGGDIEFCRRAALHGYALSYCADAVVKHPARQSWRELAGQNRRHVQGQVDISFSDGVSEASKPRAIAAFFWRLWRPDLGEWRDIACGKDMRTEGVSLRPRLNLLLLRVALYYHRALAGSWAIFRRQREKPNY